MEENTPNNKNFDGVKEQIQSLDSIEVHGSKIIPSDTFTIGEDKYMLMNINEEDGGIINLEITGMVGQNVAKTSEIPLADFENATPANFNAIFNQRLKGTQDKDKVVDNGLENGEREVPTIPVNTENHRPRIELEDKKDVEQKEAEEEIPTSAYVQAGEGISHVLERQIKEDQAVMEALPGADSFEKAMKLAQKFGYLDDTGKETRVIHRKDAAYVIAMESGKPIIREYLGGIDDNTNPLEIQREEIKEPAPVQEKSVEEIGGEEETNTKAEEKPEEVIKGPEPETKNEFEKMSDEELVQTREFLLPDTTNIALTPDYIRAIFGIKIDKLISVMPKFPSQIREIFENKKTAQIVDELGTKEIFEKNKVDINENNLTKLAYIARAIRDMNPGLEESGKTVYEFASSKVKN